MRYTTILFDLDGTLLDTLDDLTDAVNRTLARYGQPPRSRREVRAFLGNGALYLMQHAAPDVTGERFDALLRDYKADYDANCRVRTAPYPGVPALLQTLKAHGIRTGIVSNKPDSAVQPLYEAFFADTVDAAVGERDGIRRKPAPDTVLAAMERLGAAPGETLYVGDSEVDILTARNAGVDCASVTWGFRDADELLRNGAKLLFDSADALCAFLTEATP